MLSITALITQAPGMSGERQKRKNDEAGTMMDGTCDSDGIEKVLTTSMPPIMPLEMLSSISLLLYSWITTTTTLSAIQRETLNTSIYVL
jgi:hypothetical protein